MVGQKEAADDENRKLVGAESLIRIAVFIKSDIFVPRVPTYWRKLSILENHFNCMDIFFSILQH